MAGVRVEVTGLNKQFRKAGVTIEVLSGVDLVLEPGESVAVVGQSGSGKSTFMHLLGLLDRPTTGKIKLNGRDLSQMADTDRDRMRSQSIGFVFQAHNLLPEQSALGNVMMPIRIAGAPTFVAEKRAKALLAAVGLGHRLRHQPGELSGGEQQRVAIARAMAMGPGLVLADEPTGNLDPDTAEQVFRLFMSLNRQLGSTLVVVTHSVELAKKFPRRLMLERGRFVDDRIS